MRKVKFKNSRNKTLAGIIYSAGSDKVIIMCHGFASDKYSGGRTAVIAKRLNASGFDCFAFDFSGCGESQSDSISVTKEIDDLRSAITYAKSLGYKKTALYAHSLGALICCKVYSPEITTMAFGGPLIDTLIQEIKTNYTSEQINSLLKAGQITLELDKDLKKPLVIDKQIISDFEEINQKDLLTRVKCPVLLVHGNKGEYEPNLLKKTKRGMKYLPPKSKLEILDGADHSFNGYVDILTRMLDDWFKKYLR